MFKFAHDNGKTGTLVQIVWTPPFQDVIHSFGELGFVAKFTNSGRYPVIKNKFSIFKYGGFNVKDILYQFLWFRHDPHG